MEGRISSLILLFLVLSGVGAIQVNIPDEIYEHARGDNITLPCGFTTSKPRNKAIVTWSLEGTQANAKEMLILTYYADDGLTDIKQIYEGRVSIDVDIAKGKADLKLNSITLADNKVFECRILNRGDDEGKSADTARLVVLVAPSKPICKIEGKAEYGQNINLTCKSEEGSPTPTYKWQNQDVRSMPRPMAPRTVDKGGVLSLYNISKETSGYYICTSSNKIRSATCNITLAVMPPSMNIGSTAGIIGGVVAGLLALIIIIYCCCCRKKKSKEEDYAMGVREKGYTDKEPAENGRRVDGQEDQSEVNYDSRRDYDDRRSDYDDNRRDYDDNRRDYDDRRSDYDDRRSDYSDRHDKYSDRNERYNDERRYDDDRHYDERRYNDEHRYDDDRRVSDRRYDDEDDRRYDDRYDDRNNDRAPVPPNNKPRRDYDD